MLYLSTDKIKQKMKFGIRFFKWGKRRGLNPLPSEPQPDALPNELRLPR